MYGNIGVYTVDTTVVANRTDKWNFVPFANDSIAYVVFGLVTNSVKVVSLIAHFLALDWVQVLQTDG